MTTPSFDGPRLIRPGELRASRKLSQICFGDAPPETLYEEIDPSADSFLTEAGPDEVKNTYLVASGGRPVSQLSIFHEDLHAFDAVIRTCNIGGVCTHPDFRGYGLATQLLELTTRKLVDDRRHLLVISGARGLYQRVGCAPVGRYAGFTIRPGQLRTPGWEVSLRPVTPADAALVSKLYQCEPVRYRRGHQAAAAYLKRKHWGYHQEEWIVEMDGYPAAYLFLTSPWEHIGQPELGLRTTGEFAGSRVALIGALAAAVDRHGLKELLFPVPWQDADLIRLLCDCGGQFDWIPLPDHTMRVIDLPGLMSDLRGYIAARLGPKLRRGLRFAQSGPLLGHNGGDQYAIIRGKDQLELNGWDLTRLVMGAPQAEIQAPGALAEILPALFPLPSFHPGLNYH